MGNQKGIRKTITLLCNYTDGHVITKFRLKLFENEKPIPRIHLFSFEVKLQEGITSFVGESQLKHFEKGNVTCRFSYGIPDYQSGRILFPWCRGTWRKELSKPWR